MDDDIMSMMRALLEAQQARELAWGFTNHHGLDNSSTYHEGPSDGTYAHGNQSAYDAGYHPWEPPCHNGVEGSSVYQGELYAQENQTGYNAGYQAWETPSNHGFDVSSTYHGEPYAEEQHGGVGEGYYACAPTYQGGNLGGTYAHGHLNEYGEGQHACEATNHHGFDSYTNYHGAPWDDHHTQANLNAYEGAPWDEQHTQVNHNAYDEGYNSWDMHNDQGGTSSSPISIQQDHINMLQMLLDGQTRSLELINSFDFGQPSLAPTTGAAATTHMESSTTDIHHWNDEDDSDCISLNETSPLEVPPIDIGDGFEELIPNKDEFQQEADWTNIECEFLLGYGGDENLELSYEDQYQDQVVCEDNCKDGLVVDCITDACERSFDVHPLPAVEVLHVPPVYTLKTTELNFEDATKAGLTLGSPMIQPFAQHLTSLPPPQTRMNHPWKLPFENIRMKEFGGWFYDEYDPGDPQFRRVHLDKSQA